jgi:hypothetical protein
MSADLPPDVRDRAAQRIKSIFWDASYRHEDDQYLAMVDAVAAVLLGGDVIVLSKADAAWLCGVIHGEARTEREYNRAHQLLEGRRVMPDLDPDVRDRAAEAAREAFYDGTKMAHNSWARAVDAVAEVLAAEQPTEALDKAVRERDSLARRCAVRFEEAQALKARVDLLTTALTETVEKLESLAQIDIGGQVVAHRARAVLSATPTESGVDVPWIRCTCGHSPHKHGDGGAIPPPPNARCHAAHDCDHDCLCEGYQPETESEA